MKRLFLIGVFLLLTACANNHNFAPVTNGWHNTRAASQTYRVQPDDTLYSIAFRYGLDYRQLATRNHINAPYHIIVGQHLVLLPEADDTLTTSQAPSGNTQAASETVVTGGAPVSSVTSHPTVSVAPPTAATTPTAPALSTLPSQVGKWRWPARGQVIHTFSNAYGGNKGIDITGTAGENIHAAAAGRVVYCGTGLRGYGLLIIIKHNAEYISAYAHNRKALVKEGQMVKAGQSIALMGSTDAPRVMLHFEIRKAGKPVNPLDYLPRRQG